MGIYEPEAFLTPPGHRATEAEDFLAIRERYSVYLQTSGLSKETANTYLRAAGVCGRWCKQEGIPLVTAPTDDVRRFIAWTYQERSRGTGANRMLALRSFYRWAVREGLREDDPTEGMKARRDKTEPRPPFTDSELRALLRACMNLRDRVLLIVLLASGARRAEVAAMQTQDIDWGRQEIRIRRGKGGKERRVGLSVAVMSELKSYVGDRTGPVWLTTAGAPMSGHQLYQQLVLIAKRAGVDQVFVHRFRTTFANRMMKINGDLAALQTLMGHAQIEMTAHYAAYSQAERALALQRQHSLAGVVAGDRVNGEEAPSAEIEEELTLDRLLSRFRLRPHHIEVLRLMAEEKSEAKIGGGCGCHAGLGASAHPLHHEAARRRDAAAGMCDSGARRAATNGQSPGGRRGGVREWRRRTGATYHVNTGGAGSACWTIRRCRRRTGRTTPGARLKRSSPTG